MTCPRCAGLIIHERSYNCHGEGRRSIDLVRCVICGYYSDPMMDINRRASAEWVIV